MGSLGCLWYRPLGWMNWAPVLDLRQEPGCFTGSAYKYPFNPASWAWGVGLCAYFLNPISCPPALGYGERWQGLYRFSNRVRLPRVRSGLFWLGLCCRQTSYGTNDFLTFALISSSFFSFFREHPLTVCIVFPCY